MRRFVAEYQVFYFRSRLSLVVVAVCTTAAVLSRPPLPVATQVHVSINLDTLPYPTLPHPGGLTLIRLLEVTLECFATLSCTCNERSTGQRHRKKQTKQVKTNINIEPNGGQYVVGGSRGYRRKARQGRHSGEERPHVTPREGDLQ